MLLYWFDISVDVLLCKLEKVNWSVMLTASKYW